MGGVTFAAIDDWLAITGAAAAYLAHQSKELDSADRIYRALLKDLAVAPAGKDSAHR